ncbi:MAG TPA: type II secretion system F family protein [Frankiaceae bacterium]|nr:type II secretion system F family protein [Frankiaceae bacterium]
MTALAGLLAALAVLASARPRVRRDPRALTAPVPRTPVAPRRPALDPRVATVAAAVGAYLLAGPRAGPLAAFAVTVGLPRLLATLPSRAAAERDAACVAAVPLLADLVAACLTAGAPPDAAVETAARATGGPLGTDAAGAVRATRLGVPPAVAWAALLARERPAPVRALARALMRATATGAAPAAVLRAVADDARAAASAAGEAAARRAAVVAVLPLGLCFLPAFVLAGVAPLVAGLVTHTL